MGHANKLDYVELKEIVQLDRPLRIAWVTALHEKVLRLYSPHFRSHYLQDEVVAAAWAFALGSPTRRMERKKLIKSLDYLIGEAEEKNYGSDALTPAICLLSEIDSGDGRECRSAIDYDSVLFEAHQCQRQGVVPFDPALPYDRVSDYADPVYELARESYDHAKLHRGDAVRRDLFDVFTLDLTLKPLPRRLIDRAKEHSPEPEIEWLAQQRKPQHRNKVERGHR
jgi:hypothetical protein